MVCRRNLYLRIGKRAGKAAVKQRRRGPVSAPMVAAFLGGIRDPGTFDLACGGGLRLLRNAKLGPSSSLLQVPSCDSSPSTDGMSAF